MPYDPLPAPSLRASHCSDSSLSLLGVFESLLVCHMQDANPIIDYIIKSHKHGGKAARKDKTRPDGDSLAQVLMDTRAYNQAEDEKQLDGAQCVAMDRSRGHAPHLWALALPFLRRCLPATSSSASLPHSTCGGIHTAAIQSLTSSPDRVTRTPRLVARSPCCAQ